MASRSGSIDGGAWIKGLGESIGVQLGKVIAESLQRTLESSVDFDALARRLGTGASRGRRARGEVRACSATGCPNPVLAKGLCRSHYYKARYRAQKEVKPARGARKGRAGGK